MSNNDEIIDLKTEMVDWFKLQGLDPRIAMMVMVEMAGEIIGIRAKDRAGLEDGIDIAYQTMEAAAERSYQMKDSFEKRHGLLQ